MKKIDTTVDTEKTVFTFTDKSGELLSRFELYPLDVAVFARIREADNFFKQYNRENVTSMEESDKLNKEVEKQICYVIGCDAADVFGKIAALAVLPDGRVYGEIIIDAIHNAIVSAAESRKKSLEAARKYLEGYA